MMGPTYVGTSGWSYKSWNKSFYPARLPVARQFEFYTTQFSTVEINLTFYRLPTPGMVEGWRKKAPPGFVYAVKGSRFITHMKKLTKLEGAVDRYFERIEPLRKRIGVVLWQLPPILRKDLPRLRAFLKGLPRGYRHAVEFRHPSWLEPEVMTLLRRQRTAFVWTSSLAMPPDMTVTTDFVYLRFHGLEGGAAHDYTAEEMRPWAREIRRQAESSRAAYVYFNNDANVRAPGNARVFMEMTGARRVEEMAEAA
jgi:uncharacterized protein YecE (DUF72 family)